MIHSNRLESIKLLLGISCIMKFRLYQMNVESVFLNVYLNEEVCIETLKGIVDPSFPNHVFRMKKAPYGLMQAARAWCERFYEFLIHNGYKRGGIYKTLFVRIAEGKLMVETTLCLEGCQTQWGSILSKK